MNNFLNLSTEDRKGIIINTSRKTRMSEAIVEKDFWICYMLDYLFNEFEFKNFICFKGGTSLSKIYNCIERFSEDIDLAIDWSIIGLAKEDAYLNRSNRQQEIYNENANVKTECYLKEVWLPIIEKDFSKKLKEPFTIYIDSVDKQTICFEYPRYYSDESILHEIRLEIGVLAEPIPSNEMILKSYISECYPMAFNHIIKVKTVDVVRTFYEKVTILHRECNRTNEKYPKRYSRHFYDIYKMIKKDIGNKSLNQIDILRMVVIFKDKFYHCNWAKYEEIFEGKCKLIPNNEAIEIFAKDYEIMKNMFYGKYPSFDEIIQCLAEFENVLNDSILSNGK